MHKWILLPFLVMAFFGKAEGATEADAVKQRTQSYVSAYNKKDAKAMAQHWAQNAPYTNPVTGAAAQGREDIERQLMDLLQDLGNFNLTVSIESVDFPENNKAIERGKATVTRPGQPTMDSHFQVTFVKENGQWNISKVDEVEWMEAPTRYNQLKEIEWLIGEWVDKSDTFEVESSYQWDKYKNFITHTFKVSTLGKVDLEGKQIIGWDPVNEGVRSWLFDSDGGFAQGVWKKEKTSWVVESANTLPDGRIGSQTTILTPVDRNHYTLEMTGREIDGEMLPNIDPVTIVRKGGV